MNTAIEWCNSNQGILMVLLTFLYVFATFILVYMAHRGNILTEKSIRDLAKLEQERLRPLVEVRVELDSPVLVVHVTNQGQTPAYGIRIQTQPVIRSLWGGKGCYPEAKTERDIGFIVHGLASLGAGCTVSAVLGTFPRVEEVCPDLRFSGTVAFRSATGTEHCSPVDIDLRYLKATRRISRKSIHDVANQLEQISRELGHLGSGFRKPHVIIQSIADKRAEDEAAMSEALERLEQTAIDQETQKDGGVSPPDLGTSGVSDSEHPRKPESGADS
ncbi:MAG: hypothetical protein IAE97_03090 [Chthoniobacterales bacterium]|nr:hypothetical protein [Chthoniobacterales bacterium]